MAVERFINAFADAFESGTLVKCTLSKATSGEAKNVYLRRVELKKGPHAAFTFRYPTRDEVKNYPLPEAREKLTELLQDIFQAAVLLTVDTEYGLLVHKNGKTQFYQKKIARSAPVSTAHDRTKKRLIEPSSLWLHRLGITSSKGEVLASSQDKWRQINKYLEIIADLLHKHPLPPNPVIADMGSGKGYLTFALYEYLKDLSPRIVGIELRQNLVDHCNSLARECGFDGLSFLASDIADYRPEKLEMLIALHACDTATDLALAAALRQKAGIIIAAPCCHKQIRKDMQTQNELAPILQFGILEERQAEILTDGIRALLLESEGYQTRVFEFVSTEHTAKNIMIAATASDKVSKSNKAAALAKVKALKTGFGIKEHYLERLLAGVASQ